MNQQGYCLIAAVMFSVVTVGHFLRAILDISFTISGIAIPIWVNLGIALVTGSLAILGYQAYFH
jgi:hypothetical protein